MANESKSHKSRLLRPLALLLALAFTKGWETLPHKYLLLFIVPCITTVVVWTNPLHQ